MSLIPLYSGTRLPLASFSLEEKGKWFLDEERRHEDREFELAKIREERQAAVEAEERKAAAAAEAEERKAVEIAS